jgi:hypothetical protein
MVVLQVLWLPLWSCYRDLIADNVSIWLACLTTSLSGIEPSITPVEIYRWPFCLYAVQIRFSVVVTLIMAWSSSKQIGFCKTHILQWTAVACASDNRCNAGSNLWWCKWQSYFAEFVIWANSFRLWSEISTEITTCTGIANISEAVK